MLLVVGSGLLGLVVGVLVTLIIAKRGAVVEAPVNGYFKGLLDGYDVAYSELVIDLRRKDKSTDSPDHATHAFLWYPVTTESGILWAKAGTVSAKGIVLEQDKIA